MQVAQTQRRAQPAGSKAITKNWPPSEEEAHEKLPHAEGALLQ